VKTTLNESHRELNIMFTIAEEYKKGDSGEDFNNEVALDVMKFVSLICVPVFSQQSVSGWDRDCRHRKELTTQSKVCLLSSCF
jgi:hypothetical protein